MQLRDTYHLTYFEIKRFLAFREKESHYHSSILELLLLDELGRLLCVFIAA